MEADWSRTDDITVPLRKPASRRSSDSPSQAASENESPEQRIFNANLGKVISEKDFYDALSRILPKALMTKSTAHLTTKLRDADFDRVSQLLNLYGKPKWALRPRTFVVLYMGDMENAMDAFIEGNYADYFIPYRHDNLPPSLNENERERFLNLQHFVISSSGGELECGGGEHQFFDERSADAMFLYVKTLGRGGPRIDTQIDHVVGKWTLNHFALKKIPRSENWSNENQLGMQMFINELEVLKSLSHRHIVQLRGSYTDRDCIGLLMQPVADMNFASFLKQHLAEAEQISRRTRIRSFFGCIASAIEYLHTNNLRHRNIKPENILVKDDQVYVADFATSRPSAEILGRYVAPEVVFKAGDKSSDIWSLGCIFLEMCTVLAGRRFDDIEAFFWNNGTGRKAYYRNQNALEAWIKELKQLISHSDTPQDMLILDLVSSMCQNEPDQRIEAHVIVRRLYEFGAIKYFRATQSYQCPECSEAQSKKRRQGEQLPQASIEPLGRGAEGWEITTEHDQSDSFHDSGYSSMKRENQETTAEEDRLTIVSYAETVRVDEETKERSIAEFAKELAIDLEIQVLPSELSTSSTTEALKIAIRIFSQALATLARPGIEMSACVFFRQQRQRIATELLLKQLTSNNEIDIDTPPRSRSPGISAVDKVLSWFDDVHANEDAGLPNERLDNFASEPEDDDDDADPLPYFGPTKAFIKKSSAYDWLLRQTKKLLRPELSLRSCAEVLVPHLNATESSIEMTFEVEWNPVIFVQSQYRSNNLSLLHSAITLTSDGHFDQALICSEYILQTWPSTGLQLLDAIVSGLANEGSPGNDTKQWTVMPIDNHSIQVTVKSSSELVLETAEQLCWLGAACRASANPSNICVTKSLIKNTDLSSRRTGTLNDCLLFSISFEENPIEQTGLEHHDQTACWKQLFRNPSIADGFPVRSRPFSGRGLEIPLEMMAVLGEADRLKYFDDTTFLKGFRSVFYPTGIFNDSVLWHFEINKDGSHLTFHEIMGNTTLNYLIDETKLLKCRHFVGWVPSARSQLGNAISRSTVRISITKLEAGVQSADYAKIRSTKVFRSGPGCALLNATVSGGKMVTGELNFSRGVKDEAVWASADRSYGQKVHQMRIIYVNLFDDKERRGSLVDGASAILHLVRAQLCVQPYKDSAFLRIKEFKHADQFQDTEDGLSAEQKALLDKGNRQMSYDEDAEYSREDTLGAGQGGELRVAGEKKRVIKIWTVEHLICQLWEILDDLRRHQRKVRPVHLRGTTREKLEGWSMKQIIDIHPEIDPRVLHLKPSSRGWVDFLREINAVTLFARNLGDLILPAHDVRVCRNWQRVPEGLDLLAVRVQTLRAICEEYGDEDESPPRLTQNIIWHQPHMLFESCKCPDAQGKFFNKQCERVQVLLPKLTLGSKNNPEPWANLGGAVVFGRSERFKISWPIRGNPVVGDMPDDTPNQEQFDDADSGLGTSLGSSR